MKSGKEVLPILREVSEIYNGPKDGKQYLGIVAKKGLKFEDVMRK